MICTADTCTSLPSLRELSSGLRSVLQRVLRCVLRRVAHQSYIKCRAVVLKTGLRIVLHIVCFFSDPFTVLLRWQHSINKCASVCV